MRHKSHFMISSDTRKNTQKNRNHQGKSDILPFLNLLDKCTQILREDRLWVRNQLKAGDEELVNMFQNVRKPVNMQHLQIKLRKHVKAVKVNAKMEEILKFKENMQIKSRKYYQNFQETQNKSQKYRGWYGESTYRSPSANQNSSRDQRSEKKSHSSLQHTSFLNDKNFNQTSYFRGNKKAQYPPMEQITERDSENVTSARQRIFLEESFPYKNNKRQVEKVEQNFNLTYNKWQPPLQMTRSENVNTFFHEIQQEKNIKEESQFCHENDQAPLHFRQRPEPIKRDHEDESINNFSASRSNFEVIDLDYHQNSYKFIEEQASPNKITPSYEKQCQFPPFLAPSRIKENSSFNQSFNYGRGSGISSQKKNEDLFTSPELLMQCRKFIQQKGSASSNPERELLSLKKQQLFQQQTHISPLNLSETKPSPLTFQLPENIFSQIPSIQEPQYNFPVAIEHKNNSDIKNPLNYDIEAKNEKNYNYFHTFASKNCQIFSPSKNIIGNSPKVKPTVEQILDVLITHYSQQYIPQASLLTLMNRHYPEHLELVEEVFDRPQTIPICEVGRILQKVLAKGDSQIYNIYRLLDISKKGYIQEEDLEEFLFQIQQAQTEDGGQIREYLYRIFNSMEGFNQDQKCADYWSLYCMQAFLNQFRKEYEEFKDLCELLKQYEFQIQD